VEQEEKTQTKKGGTKKGKEKEKERLRETTHTQIGRKGDTFFLAMQESMI